ncbi:MAG TPA: hypothetical protein VGJ05_21760 [Fimbriiglobus sp.]|jgi:hypothetical protein
MKTIGFVCFYSVMLIPLAAGQDKPPAPRRDLGYLDVNATALPSSIDVHADWPLLAIARYPEREVRPPPHGQTPQEFELSQKVGQFAKKPQLDPPFLNNRYSDGNLAFYLVGPPGHPDDRFELADVYRDGQKLTVTLESWRTGKPLTKTAPTRLVQTASIQPRLERGEYDLTVIWRPFIPHPTQTPFWHLENERRATAKFTVYDGPQPMGNVTTLKLADFQPFEIPKAETARLWLPVSKVGKERSKIGFGDREKGFGVAAGTFDLDAWKRNVSSRTVVNGKILGPSMPAHTLASIQPAKLGDPLYATVFSPRGDPLNSLRVTAIEWKDRGFILHTRLFRHRQGSGIRSAYSGPEYKALLVRLTNPEADTQASRRPMTGKIPVTVAWTVAVGNRSQSAYLAAFRPIEKNEVVPGREATPEHPRPEWMDKGSHTVLTIRH